MGFCKHVSAYCHLRSIGVSSGQSALLRSIGVTSDQSALLRLIVSPPVNRLSFLSSLLLYVAKGSVSSLQSPSAYTFCFGLCVLRLTHSVSLGAAFSSPTSSKYSFEFSGGGGGGKGRRFVKVLVEFVVERCFTVSSFLMHFWFFGIGSS
ncbi:hypothetical protein Bca4012_096783 [Brassica carinata]